MSLWLAHAARRTFSRYLILEKLPPPIRICQKLAKLVSLHKRIILLPCLLLFGSGNICATRKSRRTRHLLRGNPKEFACICASVNTLFLHAKQRMEISHPAFVFPNSCKPAELKLDSCLIPCEGARWCIGRRCLPQLGIWLFGMW